MDLARRILLKPIEAAIAACLAIMVVLVFGNVVLRYTMNTGISVSDELSRLLFVWMVFLGAMAALMERAHLGVDTLVRRLSRKGRLVCFLLANLLMLYATWLIASGTWQQFLINLGMTTPVMGISRGWFFAPLLVFAVLSAGWICVMIVRAMTGRMQNDELIGVSESEEIVNVEAHQKPDAGKP
jgi:TRAP-type transport system small permease protein